MDKIFVPRDAIYNKCYVVQNSDVIRAYDKVPTNNTDYNYRDYYINSSYIYKDGYGSWRWDRIYGRRGQTGQGMQADEESGMEYKEKDDTGPDGNAHVLL